MPEVDDKTNRGKSNLKSQPNAENLGGETRQTSIDQDIEPLRQENNLLKAKNEILLDMVAELASEANIKHNGTNTTPNTNNQKN